MAQIQTIVLGPFVSQQGMNLVEINLIFKSSFNNWLASTPRKKWLPQILH